MEFFKSIAGKVISGAVLLAVIAATVSWYQASPEARQALVSGTGRVLSWFGIVAVLPWVTFYLIGRVGRMETNAAGATLVAAYTLLEAALLGWLFDWSITTPAAWAFAILGVFIAGAYNLFACDWIAEKVIEG